MGILTDFFVAEPSNLSAGLAALEQAQRRTIPPPPKPSPLRWLARLLNRPSDPTETVDETQSENPCPVVLAKRVDPVKLCTLEQILRGGDFEALCQQYEPIRAESDDGPWIFAIPAQLIESLSRLTPDQVSDAGNRWAATDEWVLDRAIPADVTALLQDLCRLAVAATDSGRGMYLWVSL